MPIFEFEYTNAEGQTKRVEKLMKASDRPETIQVPEGDEVYTATFVISGQARMKSKWDSYEPSDLPPINHPPLEGARALAPSK